MDVVTREFHLRVDGGQFCSTPNHTIFTGWGPNDYNPVSGSVTNTSYQLGDQFTGSGFLPYVTTIGLYDDEAKLVAVGKLSNPHKRSLSENITYVLKFDI